MSGASSRIGRYFPVIATAKGSPCARRSRVVLSLSSLEPLERRTLLSITLTGVPNWVPEGPSPQINAGNVIGPAPATTQDVGAVEALAVDPTNSKHVVAGTVNGGVWQTSDFTAPNPAWTTTTDLLPSLAIDSVAFSPVNANVIYAGTGQVSSDFAGGNAVGLYKSTDGGATWKILNPATAASPNGIFTGLRILRVVPTPLNGGQTVFVATTDASTDAFGNPTGGVYRSDDGGTSWTRLSGSNGLPSSGVTDLVENPANTNQFFAGIARASSATPGVYRLDLGVNTTWSNVSNNIAAADLSASLRVELSISPAGVNPVWASIINTTGFYQRVYRGVASGTTLNWAQVGPASGGVNLPPDILSGNHQGGLHGAVLADASSDTTAYLSGDATNSGTRAGYIVRGSSTANTWTALTPIGVAGDAGTAVPTSNGDTTAPHGDSRALVFGSGGVLLYASDGGVYQGTNPTSTTAAAQTWTYVGGNMQVSEIYTVAYDDVFHVIFGGDQDTGNPSQIAAGGTTYTDNSGGDGGAVEADNFAPAGQSIRYYFGTVRKKYDGANHRVPGDTDTGVVPAGLAGYVGFNGAVLDAIGPTAAQAAAGQSTRMVIAGGTSTVSPVTTVGAVYESNNEGTAATAGAVTWTQIPTGPGFVQVNSVVANASTEGVMASGGRRGGVANPDVLYVASGSKIFLRSAAGGTLTATAAQPAGAGTITAIALDPNDWMTAFVTDNSRVYMTTNAGASWTNVTGTGAGALSNAASLNARLAVIPGSGRDAVLFGGTNGVYRMITDAPGVWTAYGAGLPSAVVGGMVYDAADDALVTATFGRGAWELKNASTSVFTSGTLEIDGDMDFPNENDTIRIVLDPLNPRVLDVFLNSATPVFTVQFSTLQKIIVKGFGGNDTLIVDRTNGDPVPAIGGLTYDGGTHSAPGVDSLTLIGAGANVATFTRDPLILDAGTLAVDGSTITFTHSQLTTIDNVKQLTILGSNATVGTYSPDTLTVDAGTFVVDAATIKFTRVQTSTASDIKTFTLIAPNDHDVMTINSPLAAQNRVSGQSGGVAFTPLTFFNIGNFTIDGVSKNVGGLRGDQFTVDNPGGPALQASGLQNFTINSGPGNDTLTINANDFRLPVAGGLFTFNAGSGVFPDGTKESNLRGLISLDRVVINADVDYTLADKPHKFMDSTPIPDDTPPEVDLAIAQPGGAGRGTLTMFGVEAAMLTGGPTTTKIDASGFSGAAVLKSGGGNETLTGGSGDNMITGGAGTDTLIAGPARADGISNVILGGGGVNLLIGGSGVETFMASSGTTTMIGGSGQNTFIVDNPAGSVLAPIGGIEVIGGSATKNDLVIKDGGGAGFTDIYTINTFPAVPNMISTLSSLGLDVPAPLLSTQFNGEITTLNSFATSGNLQPVTQDIKVAGLSSITDSVTAKALDAFATPAAGPIALGSGTNLPGGQLNLTTGGVAFTPITFSGKTTTSVFGTGGTVVATFPPPLVVTPLTTASNVTSQTPTTATTPSHPASTTTKPSGVTTVKVPIVVVGPAPIAKTPAWFPTSGKASTTKAPAQPFVARRPASPVAPLRGRAAGKGR